MRFRHLLAILLLLAVVLAPSIPADAANPASDEAKFVGMINNLRTSRGLHALTVDSQLTAQARRWAGVMAADGVLKHAGDLSVGISANWDVLGENVGVHGAPNLNELFQAFVASPAHLANLVDARYDYVGVGVVYDDAGTIWTTHRFMGVRDAAPAPTTTAPPTAKPPTTKPPTTKPPTTKPPTTKPPTTKPPTTKPPTTKAPATARPTTTRPPTTQRPATVQSPEPESRGGRASATASAATGSSPAAAGSASASTGPTAAAGARSAKATGSASASAGATAGSADRSGRDRAKSTSATADAGQEMVAGPTASTPPPLAGGIVDGWPGTIRAVTATASYPSPSAQFIRAALTPTASPTTAESGTDLDMPLLTAVLSDVDQAGL